MCGIAGLICKNGLVKATVEKMTKIIHHRGPDGFGFYNSEAFAFGHRRLSVIDLSEAGHQPMEYVNRYVITYNGEVYNHIELRQELEEAGYKFKSHTDTEVIMASYDYWGKDCLHKFNGMWSFALYDNKENTIFCSRDRFGIKPFYYTQINDQFALASEIKQFSVIPGWKAVLNKARAFDFLENGIFDHTEETLFENVFQLRGGCSLIYDLNLNSFNIDCWYSLEENCEQANLDFNQASKKFYSLFENAVQLRLRSDVKVGSCLSGGLDSSSIVCVINKLLKQGGDSGLQETVSSCFKIEKFDEQKYIDEVVRKTNTRSNKIFPEYDSLFKKLKTIVWHQDEPFGSTSIFAQWSVFEEAKRNGLTVMLDGQGADEQLAGYHGFYVAFFMRLLSSMRIKLFLKEIRKYQVIHGCSYSRVFKDICSGFLPKLVKKSLKFLLEMAKPSKGLFNDSFKKGEIPTNFSSIYRMSIGQLKSVNLPMLLHYEDRDSMAWSIESRVPFLDYKLVEFVVGLPEEYKIRDGETKSVLRAAVKGILPEKILKRQDKMGFVTPEEVWLKENREIFRDKILESIESSKGLIRRAAVKHFDNVADGKIPFDSKIWRIIVFGEWLKVFNVFIQP